MPAMIFSYLWWNHLDHLSFVGPSFLLAVSGVKSRLGDLLFSNPVEAVGFHLETFGGGFPLA